MNYDKNLLIMFGLTVAAGVTVFYLTEQMKKHQRPRRYKLGVMGVRG